MSRIIPINPILAFPFSQGDNVKSSLEKRLTVTRPSTGTRFNSFGKLEEVPPNELRIDHDPVTRQCLGVLVEEERTNHIRNNTMAGAVVGVVGSGGALPTNWTNSARGLSTEVVGVFKNNNLDVIRLRLTGTANATESYVLRTEGNASVTASVGQVWTYSTWLSHVAGVSPTQFQTSIIENTSGGAFLTGGVLALSVSGSFNRYVHTRTLSNASVERVEGQIRFLLINGQSYDFTVDIGMPQLEQGSFATSVIPTRPTFVSRASTATFIDENGVLQTAPINEPRPNYVFQKIGKWVNLGLLVEPTRTNLWRFQDYSTLNLYTSQETVNGYPIATFTGDGATTANWQDGSDRYTDAQLVVGSIVYDRTSERKRIQIGLRGITTSINVNATFDADNNNFSFIGTDVDAWFENINERLVRIFIRSKQTQSSSNVRGLRIFASDSGLTNGQTGTLNNNVNIKWGAAQLEVVPTNTSSGSSFIPTVNSTVTRSADVVTYASVTRNADDISIPNIGAILSAEGTTFLEARPRQLSTSPRRLLSLNDGTIDNEIAFAYRDSLIRQYQGLILEDGSAQAQFNTAEISTDLIKFGLGYAPNSAAFAVNGTLSDPDETVIVPEVDRIILGSRSGSSYMNGHISNLVHYNRRLTNEQIQSRTKLSTL